MEPPQVVVGPKRVDPLRAGLLFGQGAPSPAEQAQYLKHFRCGCVHVCMPCWLCEWSVGCACAEGSAMPAVQLPATGGGSWMQAGMLVLNVSQAMARPA